MIEQLTSEERNELREKTENAVHSNLDSLIEIVDEALREIIRLKILCPKGVTENDLMWWAKEELKSWL